MQALATEYTCVGRIDGVFGIKGWVKITSFTEPGENIFDYGPWRVKLRGQWVELDIDEAQAHKNAWIAHIVGVDDRTSAETYKLKEVFVSLEQFPELDNEDFYWHQLIGLRVITEQSGAEQNKTSARDLGKVEQILETGANDVLVVQPDVDSIDDRERLIPYAWDVHVKKVDLENGKIVVDWHIED